MPKWGTMKAFIAAGKASPFNGKRFIWGWDDQLLRRASRFAAPESLFCTVILDGTICQRSVFSSFPKLPLAE